MLAVIETGGKQYLVSPNQKIKIEKIKGLEEGQEVVFDKVLLLKNNGDILIGQPYLGNQTIKGKVLKIKKGKKIIVFRYHSKTRYRKKKGHRQYLMEVEILPF
ncbi:MAG: 50S ribosomal protein L21 [Minisyncoccia bacterium]